MTTIKATCPSCGEVTLTPDDIELRVVEGDEADRSYYAFLCPDCLEIVRKPADSRVIRLLVSGGVEALTLVEVRTLAERYDGPPFGPDDLLDFHLLLSTDGWIDQLLIAESLRQRV